MDLKHLNYLDKKHIWHPCSQMMDYEDYPAIPITRAQGVWLYQADGKKILDAISSWWVNIFGHCHPHIVSRIREQVGKLEHVIFANYTHESAIILSRSLSALFADKLPKVFFTDNGSSAVEAALKMSYQYWFQKGEIKKKKFIYISGAYHGETLGALAVGALGLYKKVYQPLLMDSLEAPGPDCFRCDFGLVRHSCDAPCFEKTLKVLKENHTSTCAFIIEPLLQAAGGMKMYPPIYLRKVRAACSEWKIHLICDEIASGFGRTGKIMASHHAEITPDFVTLAKGLTGGFLSLAVVLTSEEIFNEFYAPYQDSKAFMHSHSYSGNPIACSAACAVMELFEKMDILSELQVKSSYIRQNVLELLDHKNIGEIRTLGMVTAIELVEQKSEKRPFAWQKRVGYRIYRKAENKGVLLRNLGDVIYFMPPLIIEEKEIDFMTIVAKESIREILAES
jgi:adenosylmethionine-8-amino-7-oxononanoate aminotransferase